MCYLFSNKILQVWSIFVVSCFIFSCNKDLENVIILDVESGEEVQLVGEKLYIEDEQFNQPVDIHFSNVKSEVIVFQENPDALFRFDISTNKIISKTFLTKGEGPGEFKNSGNMVINDTNYFLTDKGDYTIEIFDSSVTHMQTLQLSGMPISIDVYNDIMLMTSFVEIGQSKIELFDTKPIKTLIIPAQNSEALFAVGKPIFIDENQIGFIRFYVNEIFIVNINTGEQKKLRIEQLDDKSNYEKRGNLLIPTNAVFLDIADQEENIFILTGSRNEKGQLLIEVNKKLKVKRYFYLDTSISRFTIKDNVLIGYSQKSGEYFKFIL